MNTPTKKVLTDDERLKVSDLCRTRVELLETISNETFALVYYYNCIDDSDSRFLIDYYHSQIEECSQQRDNDVKRLVRIMNELERMKQ